MMSFSSFTLGGSTPSELSTEGTELKPKKGDNYRVSFVALPGLKEGNLQFVDADGNAMDEDDEYAYEDSDDDSHDLGGTAAASSGRSTQTMDLSQMFAQPTHLMHRAGGFMGAKNFAKDARRWLLVNIQSEDDFACHALNRDVWRNDMVESIVREGFILFQAVSCILCLI